MFSNAQGDDLAPIPGTKRVSRLEENARARPLTTPEPSTADARGRARVLAVSGLQPGDDRLRQLAGVLRMSGNCDLDDGAADLDQRAVGAAWHCSGRPNFCAAMAIAPDRRSEA